MFRFFFFVLFLLSACSDIPEIGVAEARLGASGATPALLTAEALATLTGATDISSPALTADAAALRARADRLRAR